MRMLLSSSFDTYTGYGNDAVDMALWFSRAGVDVVPWPKMVMPGLPRAFTDLLTKEPSGDYDLAVQFMPPFDLHAEDVAGLARTAVGWSMWEKTPLVPADMVGHGWKRPGTRKHWWSRHARSGEGRKKDYLDRMIVTCHDNVDAFRALDATLDLAVCPNGIDPVRFPVLDRPLGEDRPMRFLSIGMLAGRKDPFATLEAWRRAQEIEPAFDAELILKTSCSGLHPAIEQAYPGVRIINEVWPAERVLDLYGRCDVLVSTSRGEGNNKPAMEFMSTGGAVMATDWSGHRNWLHPSTGYPLPGSLVTWPDGVRQDFRVDIEATAQTFVHCWRNRPEVRRKGELAARTIRADLSWEKVCERFLRLSAEVM